MDADRNAALFRQRMAQTNQNLGPVYPPAPQQRQFDPRLARPPHMPPATANPPPPGAPRPMTRLTGRSPKIPGKMDPTNRYGNLKHSELQGGEEDDKSGSVLDGVNQLVTGIMTVVALSTVFVLPKQLKVFWAIVLGLTILIHLGFMLYKEWMESGKKGGEDAKYSEWAAMLLYCLVMLYTAVMVGILFFMAWSLYSIANSKTNLARLDRAAIQDREVERRRYV